MLLCVPYLLVMCCSQCRPLLLVERFYKRYTRFPLGSFVARTLRSEYVRFDHTQTMPTSATICPSCQQLQLLCPCLGTCVLTEFHVGLEAGVMKSRSVVVVGRGVFEDEEELHFHPIVVACLHRPEQLTVHDNT